MHRQIKTFKWKGVMAFMKANPNILSQYLSIMGLGEFPEDGLDNLLNTNTSEPPPPQQQPPSQQQPPPQITNMKPRYT